MIKGIVVGTAAEVAVLFGSGLMRTLLHDIMIRQKMTIKKCLSSGQNGDIL